MWHNENSQADVKNFIKAHSGTLVGFIFHYEGLTIQMHWKEKDIYEYFKEYKHSQKKIGVSKKIPARDFPFGAVDDVYKDQKNWGLILLKSLVITWWIFRYTECQYFLIYLCKKFGRGHCH
jgi:hypothetical protein